MWKTISILAWRNLWRNKRRTLITLSAVSLGIAALVFVSSLVKGMDARLRQSATGSLIGDAQIQRDGYRQTGEPELLISGVSQLVAGLERNPSIEAASPRVIYPCLAAMGDRSRAVVLLAVEPQRERNVTNWEGRIYSGHYPKQRKDVLLGNKLAERLELDVDAKLVVTLAALGTGELQSQLVRISGLMVSENPLLAENCIVMTMELAESMLGVSDRAHEIAIRLPSQDLGPEEIVAQIGPPSDQDLDLLPWQTIMPELESIGKLQDVFMLIAFAIVFCLAAMGIANTMGMSILERMQEFGVLKALGTTPKQLAQMVACEYLTLGFIGALIGYGLGFGISSYFAHVGIPISDVEVMGVALNDPVFPIFDLVKSVGIAAIYAILTPLLSWLPIRRVNRMDAMQALRFQV